MGVPKFYRWVSERYPLINQKIGKDTQFLAEVDNMYLDMNGIIHNCTHPNDEDVSDKISMKDMVLGMFSYVDRMVHIVNPQKVVVLAVDGCAPRAKMNQQRSRRFASARDRREGLEKALRDGAITEEEMRDQFDSNCITPGTEFMAEVSRHFQYFVRLKIKEDPRWRKLKVIYSGHDVPGEGEHKIMDYIRHTRMQPDYDPNTRHCLCGLDADLIMLGLASHEPHFVLLREEVDFTGGRGGKKGGSQTTKEIKKQVEQDKWELLHLSALRQYLHLEFSTLNLGFGYDLERVIDDWVLLIMLVGNDFLPHLPSLSIADGGLDDLMQQYKTLLPQMSGYITENGFVHFDRLEKILQTIGNREEQVFTQRVRDMEREQRRQYRYAPTPPPQPLSNGNEGSEGEEDSAEKVLNDAPFAQFAREKGIITDQSGFKEKYYAEKFGVDVHDEDEENRGVLNHLVRSYIEGIQWCYLYYYQGVQSWTWFFPFHYAPLASDMRNLANIKVTLQKGQPFKPFMQLLSCLPSDSAKFLPECYRELMTLTTSPLAEFYPRTFRVDMNGKRNPWEGVNLLPFIDEKKLMKAVNDHCPEEKLSEAELKRNTFGHEIIFEADASNTSTVPSSFPSAGLPDIEVCQSTARRFALPPMESFDPNLLPGVVGDGKYPGDPQVCTSLTLLASRPAELLKAGVCVFNRESRKESMIVNIRTPSIMALGVDNVSSGSNRSLVDDIVNKVDDDDDSSSIASALVRVLQKLQDSRKDRLTVFVDYPNLREAQVVAVADDVHIFNLHEEKKRRFGFRKDVQTETDSDNFLRLAEVAQDRALRGARQVGTGGMEIGEVVCMLKVRPLQGMNVDQATGAASQVYSDVETWVPYQLVCYKNEAPDPRFMSKPPPPVEQRFPQHTMVMSLQKAGYGMVGKVVGHEGGMVKAEFDKMSPQIPPFGTTIAKSLVDKYVPAIKAARTFNIDSGTLGKITGSVLVRPGHYDIGLNLKVGRSYVIPGYARAKAQDNSKAAWSTGESVTVISGLDPEERQEVNNNRSASGVSGGWEYSPRALELVAAYQKKFPEVFKALQSNPSTVEYTISSIFGSGDQGRRVLDQVCKWLEQIDTFRLPLVPTTSKTMSRDAIKAVQSASDDVRKSILASGNNGAKVVIKMSPEVIYKNGADIEAEWSRSPTANFPPNLGDRVANMGSPVVPFGLTGTVVATHASTGCVEVVFDEEFIGGTSLYGACGQNRGKLLPWAQLLNLTKRNPLVPGRGRPAEKAQAPGKEQKSNQSNVGATQSQQPKSNAATSTPAHERQVGKSKKAQAKAAKQTSAPQNAQSSRFVVPPAPVGNPAEQDQHQPQEDMEVDNEDPFAVLTGASASSAHGSTETPEDLADYWLQLQKANKDKRAARKAKKQKQQTEPAMAQPDAAPTHPQTQQPKKQPVAKDNNNTAQASAPQQQQPQQTAWQNNKPQLASPMDFASQQPAPAPQQQPPQPQQSEDTIEELFKRATKAAGKDYKPKQPEQQQQHQQHMMPPPQGYPMPYGYGYPPPYMGGPPMQQPQQQQQSQQQQK